jgi:hypothetical protein
MRKFDMNDIPNREQRDKIVAKIRALQAKASDRSVTETEAVLFARKAAELTAQYNLTFTELEASEEVYARDCRYTDDWTGKASHPVIWTMTAIGHLYNCKPWRQSYHGCRGSVTFFGTKSDTEQAHYLLELCYNAIEFEVRQYRKSWDYGESVKFGASPKSLLNSFRKGMASRLASRIQEMVAANKTVIRTGGGTAIVLVRDAALKAALKDDGIRLRSYSGTGARHSGANTAGMAAGDRTSLSRGVGSTGVRQIGQR